MRPWLNWIERLTTDQEVGGSNPPGRAINFLKLTIILQKIDFFCHKKLKLSKYNEKHLISCLSDAY